MNFLKLSLLICVIISTTDFASAKKNDQDINGNGLRKYKPCIWKICSRPLKKDTRNFLDFIIKHYRSSNVEIGKESQANALSNKRLSIFYDSISNQPFFEKIRF